MARTIFLILLLLNLVVLAWVYANGNDRINASREPQRIKAQLAGDRIHIVAMIESGISAGAGLSAAQTAPLAETDTCHAYVGATIKEAQQIAQALAGKFPAARIVASPISRPSSFDLAISGLASRVLAEAKLAELKRLGINDAVQIKVEEDKRFSLVIASFTERSAAEEALKTANKKGVVSAVVIEHKFAPEKSTIEIRGSESALKKLPEQLASFKMLSAVLCSPQ